MIIRSQAPSRIDLAGGTLDIFPLNLFTDGGITVNAAIGIASHVTLETRKDKRIEIFAEDVGKKQNAAEAARLRTGGFLDLIARIVKYYDVGVGLDVRTRNDAPAGSGLGASSSLLIALSHALNKLKKKPLSTEDIIHLGANLEAQSIRIPTGKQDYYSATCGGINAIWFDTYAVRVEPLVVDKQTLAQLESRLVLSFTGETHFSGTSNWAMMRAYIDGNETTVRNIHNIKKTTLKMRQALKNSDLSRFGRILAEEWENRKALAEGVTTPGIDRLMARAREAGAVSSKICGAGGGGCMITWVKAGKRAAVESALRQAGAEILPLEISRRGVTVEVEK